MKERILGVCSLEEAFKGVKENKLHEPSCLISHPTKKNHYTYHSAIINNTTVDRVNDVFLQIVKTVGENCENYTFISLTEEEALQSKYKDLTFQVYKGGTI